MIDSAKDDGVLETAKLVSAVRGYQLEGTRREDEITDFTVSPSESDERILIRAIARRDGKAGYVGIDAVKEMSRTLQRQRYNKGILVAKRFTAAAQNQMMREDIETVHVRIPRFKLDDLYLVIQGHVDAVCRAKCGQTPDQKSDCQGHLNSDYTCKIRLLSDDASFHFKHGWTSLLERDLVKLLTIEEDRKV